MRGVRIPPPPLCPADQIAPESAVVLFGFLGLDEARSGGKTLKRGALTNLCAQEIMGAPYLEWILTLFTMVWG